MILLLAVGIGSSVRVENRTDTSLFMHSDSIPPHSPTPIPGLTVHGAAGAKTISCSQQQPIS